MSNEVPPTHQPTPRFVFASAAAFVRAIRDAEAVGLGGLMSLLAEDGLEIYEDGRVALRWSPPATR
jgi:hypothetical protein